MNGSSELREWHAPSDLAEAVDLDVTPVMNMFVILIPFLVSMAVFTHFSILEFSLPPNVGTGLDISNGKPKLKLTVVLTRDYLAVTCGENMLDSIPLVRGEYNYPALQESLAAHRNATENQSEAVVAVRDGVRFKHVVTVMDRVKEKGFTRIGLSSATEDAVKGI